MIALACATGISPSEWAAEGERAVVTAIDVLDKQNKKNAPGKASKQTKSPQMSG